MRTLLLIVVLIVAAPVVQARDLDGKDLDDFADVNARVGNLVGDRILRETAEVLNACSRDIDRAARPGVGRFYWCLGYGGRAGGAHQSIGVC